MAARAGKERDAISRWRLASEMKDRHLASPASPDGMPSRDLEMKARRDDSRRSEMPSQEAGVRCDLEMKARRVGSRHPEMACHLAISRRRRGEMASRSSDMKARRAAGHKLLVYEALRY
jgi:hypothetical protein